MRRRQHLGWNFRPERVGPPRWASGLSEGTRRRAGAYPRLRQQSLEAAWRGGEQGREKWMGTSCQCTVRSVHFVHAQSLLGL